MAGLTGLEPATSCVTGRRSNQTELQPLTEGRKSRKEIPSLCHAARRPFPLKGSETRGYVKGFKCLSQAKHIGKRLIKTTVAALGAGWILNFKTCENRNTLGRSLLKLRLLRQKYSPIRRIFLAMTADFMLAGSPTL